MKKLMTKIKFGALLTGLIFILSCSGDAAFVPATGQVTAVNELSSVASEGGLVEKSNFDYSSALNNSQVAGLAKNGIRPNRIVTTVPISFGTADVTLVLN